MYRQICPVCNGLFHLHEICTNCQGQMDEIGKMEDYMGPYNPYTDKENFTVDNKELLMGDHLCIHLYYCESCDRIEYRSILPLWANTFY